MGSGEPFGPVVNFVSIRSIYAAAADLDSQLHQMHAKIAFLNGDMEEHMFTEILQGVSLEDLSYEHLDFTDIYQIEDVDSKIKLGK